MRWSELAPGSAVAGRGCSRGSFEQMVQCSMSVARQIVLQLAAQDIGQLTDLESCSSSPLCPMAPSGSPGALRHGIRMAHGQDAMPVDTARCTSSRPLKPRPPPSACAYPRPGCAAQLLQEQSPRHRRSWLQPRNPRAYLPAVIMPHSQLASRHDRPGSPLIAGPARHRRISGRRCAHFRRDPGAGEFLLSATKWTRPWLVLSPSGRAHSCISGAPCVLRSIAGRSAQREQARTVRLGGRYDTWRRHPPERGQD